MEWEQKSGSRPHQEQWWEGTGWSQGAVCSLTWRLPVIEVPQRCDADGGELSVQHSGLLTLLCFIAWQSWCHSDCSWRRHRVWPENELGGNKAFGTHPLTGMQQHRCVDWGGLGWMTGIQCSVSIRKSHLQGEDSSQPLTWCPWRYPEDINRVFDL